MGNNEKKIYLNKEEIFEALRNSNQSIETTFKSKEEALNSLAEGNFVISSKENDSLKGKDLVSSLSECVHKYKLIDNDYPISISISFEDVRNSIPKLEELLERSNEISSKVESEKIPSNVYNLIRNLSELIELRLKTIRCISDKKDYEFIRLMNRTKKQEKEVYNNMRFLFLNKLRDKFKSI